MKKIELKQQTLIDKIELKNGEIISIQDMEELARKDILVRNNDMPMYETEYGERFSYLKILNDKWIHQLKAGVTGFGKQYVNLQMGIYNEYIGNLVCNTVDEYHSQLKKVKKYLIEKYGILASFRLSEIKSIELNRTFEIEHPFEDYHRVLKLLIDEMPNMNIVSFFGQTSKDRKCFDEKIEKIGTYSAWSSKKKSKSKQYKKITFYDKGNQVKVSVQDNLMRVELMIKGSKNIRSAFGTDYFYDLRQDKIDKYFDEQIQKMIVAPIEKWKVNRNRYVLKLIKEEYEKEVNNSWQVNILRRLMNKEVEENKPCILGIEELCSLVDRYKWLKRKSRIKSNLRVQAAKYEKVFCNGDDLKLQEIIDKLLAKDTATVDLYLIDGLAS